MLSSLAAVGGADTGAAAGVSDAATEVLDEEVLDSLEDITV